MKCAQLGRLRRSSHVDNGNLWAEPPFQTNFASLLRINHKSQQASPRIADQLVRMRNSLREDE